MEKIYLMKCGHTSNAKTSDGKPCCCICNCTEIVKEMPSLEGRMAKCPYCNKIKPSNYNLPFFEYRPNEINDWFYDGCLGWD